MNEVHFPNWQQALSLQSELSDRQRQSFEITIRWYLSFCRRSRTGVTVQSARDFIECVVKENEPHSWRLEQWNEAVRWFFRQGSQISGSG